MLQHLLCKLQSTRSWAVLPSSWVWCLSLKKFIILLRPNISSILVHEPMIYCMMYQETDLSQLMEAHGRGLSNVLQSGMLCNGVLFRTRCCGFSPAQRSHMADTAGWQVGPIYLIVYEKSRSSEESGVLLSECLRHRPRWGSEGGENRAISFIPGEAVCLHLQERGRKGWVFSLGQCKLLAFGSQGQVFLLHY